jgi:hypothetical protein
VTGLNSTTLSTADPSSSGSSPGRIGFPGCVLAFTDDETPSHRTPMFSVRRSHVIVSPTYACL